MNAALQRLRAEIGFDRAAFAARIEELAGLHLPPDSSGADQRARAAVALHHAYGVIDSIMVRAARFLEGDVPEGPDWQQGLLQSMGLAIDGVRPAIFSADTIAVLRHLLGFRHFFRHAYAVDLDAARLDILGREMVEKAPRILTELDSLDAFLSQVSAGR